MKFLSQNLLGVCFLMLATGNVHSHSLSFSYSPLTESEKAETQFFTASYLNLKSAIENRMKAGEATAIVQESTWAKDLANCLPVQEVVNLNETHFLLEGSECKVKYRKMVSKKNTGLNENGDPITENIVSETLVILNSDFINSTGIVSWSLYYSDRHETLASTPVELLSSHERLRVLMSNGKEIVTDISSRFYINMEFHETTFFRELTMRFENFTVNLDLRREARADGVIKEQFLRLNNISMPVDEAVQILTPMFVGLENI